MPYQDALYYYAYHARDRDRTPLVLIHGAGGDHLHWPVQMRRMSGFRVYALDLPGHGKSKGHGLQRIDGYAQAVLDWLNGMEIPRAVLIGHSMGSAICLWMALHHPDRIWGAGLVGAGPRLPVNPALLEETGHSATFPNAVDKIVKWSFSPDTERSLVETARERMLETRPSVLHGDFKACHEFDVAGRLAEIKIPAQVVCGEDDKMVPLSLSRELARGIPEADLEIIPGTGHMMMIEKPQAVAEVVRSFLEGLSLDS